MLEPIEDFGCIDAAFEAHDLRLLMLRVLEVAEIQLGELVV